MNKNFLLDIISTYTSLTGSDLEILNKLSVYYNVFQVDNLINKNIEVIINEIILNELPFYIAKKQILPGHNNSFNQIVEFKNGIVTAYQNNFGQYYIDKEVTRINKLLDNES